MPNPFLPSVPRLPGLGLLLAAVAGALFAGSLIAPGARVLSAWGAPVAANTALCAALVALSLTLIACRRARHAAQACAAAAGALALLTLAQAQLELWPAHPAWRLVLNPGPAAAAESGRMPTLAAVVLACDALAAWLLAARRGRAGAMLIYLAIGTGTISALSALAGLLVASMVLSGAARTAAQLDAPSCVLLVLIGVYGWNLADRVSWLRAWRRRQPGADVFVYAVVLLASMLVVVEFSVAVAARLPAPGVQIAVILACAVIGATLLGMRIVPVLQAMRRAEAALAAALRRDQLLLRHVGEGVIGLDAEARITFANAAAERMFGHAAARLAGAPLARLIGADRADDAAGAAAGLEPLRAVLETGATRRVSDAPFVRADGAALEVECVAAPVREGARISGAVLLLTDVAERRRTERALARWQQVFEHAGWGIAVSGARSECFELVNPAFARLHGYAAGELLGHPVRSLVAPDFHAEVERALVIADRCDHYDGETWHVRKDRTRFPVQVDLNTVRDAQGAIGCYVLAVQDITARHAADRALREREAALANAQAQARLGSWVYDLPTGALTWSAETRRMFGFGPEDAVSAAAFYARVHPDDRAPVARALDAALAGMPYDIEHRIVVGDRVYWVRERADIEFDAAGRPLRALGTVHDVTEARQKEAELRASRQALRELAAHHERIREDERTRIAREIHDELGQYLTALRMDAAMLQIRHGGADPELARLAEGMKQTIDTTIGVVRNVAAALRPGALDLGLVPAVEWLLADVQRRTGIQCRLEAEIGELELDDERATAVFRILQESMTNIVRHAQAGRVQVRILRADGAVRIEIGDDGVGFDRAVVRKKRTFGLMGVRERARAFGGQVKIDTTPGAGTTVRVRLPLAERKT